MQAPPPGWRHLLLLLHAAGASLVRHGMIGLQRRQRASCRSPCATLHGALQSEVTERPLRAKFVLYTMLSLLRDAQLGVGRAHHAFASVPGWNCGLVKRLKLERTLEGHDGAMGSAAAPPNPKQLTARGLADGRTDCRSALNAPIAHTCSQAA